MCACTSAGGNYNGPHECDVALADIWPEIAKAKVGSYLLSLANPRHEHEVALFKDGILPTNAGLAAGVIDTTSNYVEHPEVVAHRIERAAEAVGDPKRVQPCTDCGFETSAGYILIPEDLVWAKLRALRDGAALATKCLFGYAILESSAWCAEARFAGAPPCGDCSTQFKQQWRDHYFSHNISRCDGTLK